MAAVAQVVRSLPVFRDPNLLVGPEGFSDAGVYRLADDLAIVQTIDFFPPLVDDPFVYGQIAAANALGDLYAMGARPLTALNVVSFPDKDLDLAILSEILRGGAERVAAAGAVILGGHSVRDDEIVYGLAATGVVNPAKMMTNSAARPGDAIVLTKALGTGFVTTALKGETCPDDVYGAACASMIALNDVASRAAVEAGARAATDVTGFGLAGHALEMAEASDVAIHFELSKLPQLPGAIDLARTGRLTRANKTNRDHVAPHATLPAGAPPELVEFLFDPQTSGGLLIAVAPPQARRIVEACRRAGGAGAVAAIVGRVEAARAGAPRIVATE